MRPALALSALLLCGAVHAAPETQKVVEIGIPQDLWMKSMVQVSMLGDLQVYAIVYKPRLYPLSGLMERLARGEFKKALTTMQLRYQRSNIDDKALATLLKHGFIPTYVVVTNTGAKAVDASRLRMSLDDDDFSLAAIPNDKLPDQFKRLDPRAVAANYYNTTMTGVTAVINLIIAGTNGAADIKLPSVPEKDRKVVDPVAETKVDYNGLLFQPGALAPGKNRRGLLFFKAKGVDWSALKLQASLP